MDTRYCLHPVIVDENIAYPCGICPSCRMKYRKQMAVRIYMEYLINKPTDAYFITLTYDPQFIPSVSGRSCFSKEHVNRFLDSLRHKLRLSGFSLRYFGTCEYGEEGYRPHYHFIFFLYGGHKPFRYCPRAGIFEFHRDYVEPLWQYGFSYDGRVTLPAVMYCTAYALKDDESLERDWTGFEEGRPFRVFSLKPGLGLTDECINWWTNYVYNGGEFRSTISLKCSRRSVSTGVPVGIKRKISDIYPDVYEGLKGVNQKFFDESLVKLFENAKAYGSYRNYTNKCGVDPIDFTPDSEILAFRKALRKLSKTNKHLL